MIVITRTPESIKICGHANYAEHGKDIVCSAVSVLWQTLLWSIDELTEDEVKHTTWPDKTKIKFWNLSEDAQLLIDSFFIGVKAVAMTYPDHVKVVE